MTAINLNQYVANLAEPWQPITVAQYNGNDVMVARGSGAYDWHMHDNSDDLFLVLQGEVVLEMRDNDVLTRVTLKAGEMHVVPQGLVHRPVASDDAYFVLIERKGINSEML
jgi:mannose-6-phosphate isomerase-like protein (cupin superfamily)